MSAAFVVPAFVALAFATIPGDARADIISDEEGECRSKAEGDACSLDGKSGKCTKSTCTRNDYSGGTPPKSVSSDCLVCKPGGAATPLEKVVTPEKDEPAKPDPTAKTDGKPDTKGADSKPPETKAGCSSGAGEPGAWMLGSVLLGLGLVGVGRRRSAR